MRNRTWGSLASSKCNIEQILSHTSPETPSQLQTLNLILSPLSTRSPYPISLRPTNRWKRVLRAFQTHQKKGSGNWQFTIQSSTPRYLKSRSIPKFWSWKWIILTCTWHRRTIFSFLLWRTCSWKRDWRHLTTSWEFPWGHRGWPILMSLIMARSLFQIWPSKRAGVIS